MSASCTVQQRRFSSQAARASTAIKVPAPLALGNPRTISALSSPVEARTPGAKAQQSAKGPNRSGRRRRRWRVTKTYGSVRGPMASGVMAALPSPTIRTGPGAGPSSWASCAPRTCPARWGRGRGVPQ